MASTPIEEILTRGVKSRPLFDLVEEIDMLRYKLAELEQKPEPQAKVEVIKEVVREVALEGRDGSDGSDGRDGQDGKGLNWRGTYVPGETYFPHDVVHYDGSSYICVKQAQGRPPISREYWNLLAERGSNGGGGTAGPQLPTDGRVPMFVQPNEPTTDADKYVWVQTGLGDDGKGHTMWFRDCEGNTL